MSITTFSDSPYHDDLNLLGSDQLSPLDKNYLRVLFKPGVSVQTRELNQAQSILQAQLDRLGRSLYRANSAVIGGDVTINSNLKYVDVQIAVDQIESFNNQSNSQVEYGVDPNNAIAKIERVDIIGDSTSLTRRLFIQEVSGSGSILNDNITTVTINSGNQLASSGITGTIIDRGVALGCSLNSGIFFVKGCLASSVNQYAATTVYSSSSNNKLPYNGFAVLKVTEKIIIAQASELTDSENYIVDPTLLDNANGSLNESAPGADRYKIDLELQLLTQIPDDGDFVKLAEIRSGAVVRQENSIDASGSTLEKILSQRTYEESGNYVVKDFDTEIQNAVGSGFDSKYKTWQEANQNNALITQANNENYFACTVSPGLAYVRGTRVELLNPITLFEEKARTLYSESNQNKLLLTAISANVGNYVSGETVAGSNLPLFDNAIEYTLYNSDNDSIGTTKILTVEYKGPGLTAGIAKLDVHLYDILLDSGKKFSEVTRIGLDSPNQFNFNVETVNGINLNNTAVSTSLFKLPYNQIETVSNFRFSEKVTLTSTSFTPTSAKFTAPGKAFDKSASNILVYRGSSIITNFSVNILPNEPASELNLTLPSGSGAVTVVVSLSNITDAQLGLKTNTTENVVATRVATTNIFTLNNVFHAITVNNPVWKLIDDGQRPNEYVNARVEYIGTGSVPSTTTNINVTHWKFSGGNYYTVDSYRKFEGGKVSIDQIPTYLNQRLGDVIDTRYVSGQNDRLAFDPSSVISFNIDFYLPRRDSLCVSPEGNFFFVKGDPDIYPVAKPIDEDTQCVLYELFIPAYTFSPDTIIKTRKSNRRYTMRDIGKLDKRVGTIEYYTTLSLLEKSATDKSIFQGTRERFKNGFVTDGFRNHAVGDFNNPEYRCSIDSQRGRLYPYHSGYSLPLVRADVSNTNVISTNNLMHFAFENVEANGLSQQQASQFISLQPHEVISAAGFMQLYPEVDTWSDRTTNPPRTIELFPGLDDVISELGTASGIIGTEWSDWATTSVNVSRTPRAQSRSGQRLTRTTNQTSTGIQTNIISENISNSLGEFITDVSIRPYMRSRAVWLKAEALKPNSQFYFFFDGINVTNFVRSVNETDFNSAINRLSSDDGLNESTLLEKYQPNGPIISDENGTIFAVFVVPNNESLKFSSGEKTLKITNSPRDIEEETTSVATARFISNGLGITRNDTIISTSVPRIQRQVVSRTRQVVRRFDPVAQTFRVDDETGIFLTGVDLYFATKPSDFNKVGVQAYLVTVKNGYPTDDIIPGSESFVRYEDINTSFDSSVSTRFNFPQPVYVEGNTEYALVVFSESNEYNIYIAEMAGNRRDLLTQQIIANQPALGVFFTSSNKTTWSASQNRDLKFKMYRAKFNTGLANIIFNPSINSYITGVSTVAISGSNNGWSSQQQRTITVSMPDLADGVRAEVEPVFDFNLGVITGFNIVKNGFGYVTAPTVTVTEIGTSKTATFQAQIASFNVAAVGLNQKTINVAGKTQVSNQLQLGENVYNIEVGSPLENIINANHVITRSNQSDSTKLIVKMSTTDDRVSPIIDLNGFSLQTREYDVKPNGKTSAYLTKQIALNNPSDQLDLFIDINRPTTTSNIDVFVNVKDSRNQTIGSEWNQMILVDGSNTGINSNRDIFSELRYTYNPNIDFVYFTIKIEFRGSNVIDIATCQDLRVIATV